jgi:uncharacterized damage-inducible protein DinB
MKETTRITKLYEDLYDGSPWLGVVILPALKKLSASQAARRIDPEWNTIWEIVNHMISWRENVLKRVQGQLPRTPAHNYITPVEDTNPAAWKATLSRLEASQQAWLGLLKKFKSPDFNLVYPGNQMTFYEHIHGILQHDAYHLGQIVILAKKLQ